MIAMFVCKYLRRLAPGAFSKGSILTRIVHCMYGLHCAKSESSKARPDKAQLRPKHGFSVNPPGQSMNEHFLACGENERFSVSSLTLIATCFRYWHLLFSPSYHGRDLLSSKSPVPGKAQLSSAKLFSRYVQ